MMEQLVSTIVNMTLNPIFDPLTVNNPTDDRGRPWTTVDDRGRPWTTVIGRKRPGRSFCHYSTSISICNRIPISSAAELDELQGGETLLQARAPVVHSAEEAIERGRSMSEEFYLNQAMVGEVAPPLDEVQTRYALMAVSTVSNCCFLNYSFHITVFDSMKFYIPTGHPHA